MTSRSLGVDSVTTKAACTPPPSPSVTVVSPTLMVVESLSMIVPTAWESAIVAFTAPDRLMR